MRALKIIVATLIALAAPFFAKAQFVEDALRYALPNGMVTPRAAGMNVSYHGLSDDAAALMYNPAGLSLIGRSELNFGLGFTRNSTEANYLDTDNLWKTNNEFITHASIAMPFDMKNANGSLAIGYFRESDFNDNIRFDAFNRNSTMIATEAPYPDKEYNWAYNTWLTDENLSTPITDSLQQTARILESGGLHTVAAGASFEMNDYVSFGFTFAGKWGSYGYDRKYEEIDSRGLYDSFAEDYSSLAFNKLTLNENIDQTVSGITASIGVLAKLEDFMRFGASIEFPTWYDVDEKFSQTFIANFAENPNPEAQGPDNSYVNEGEASYSLRTPFVYSAGVSMHGMGLTFSAGVEYTDASQMEFYDATYEVEDLNFTITEELHGLTTWGFGMEYDIPMVPVIARTSYERTTSPYVADIPGADVSRFSVGGGVYVGKSVRIDGVFRWSSYSELRTNYGTGVDRTTYVIDRSPLNLGFQVTYRY